MNVTELLKSTGDPIEQRSIIRGYVSTNRPAPTGFPVEGSEANLLWVIVPGYSPNVPFGPCRWDAIHGSSLPKQGAEAWVAFDENNKPKVISWEGETTETLAPGIWMAPESTTSAVELVSVQARLEQRTSVIRYRGVFTAKENIVSENTLFTMPSTVRPTAERFGVLLNASTGGAARATIETSGQVKYYGTEVTKGSIVSLEGITIVK